MSTGWGEMEKTQTMYLCSKTHAFEDLKTVERILNGYKQRGGKLPPQLEKALELAKTGKNVEDSINHVCDALFEFYLNEETRCAKEAGFSSLDKLEQARPVANDDRVERADACMLNVTLKWQATSVDFTLNFNNKNSLVRQFYEKTKDQLATIAGRWVRRKALQKAKTNSPSGENPSGAPSSGNIPISLP